MLHASARHQFPSTNNKYQMNKSLCSALNFSVCNKAMIRDFQFSVSFHSMISICRKGSTMPLMMPHTWYKTIVPMIRLAIGEIGSGFECFGRCKKNFIFQTRSLDIDNRMNESAFIKETICVTCFVSLNLLEIRSCLYVFTETLHVLKSHSVTALISYWLDCFEDLAQKQAKNKEKVEMTVIKINTQVSSGAAIWPTWESSIDLMNKLDATKKKWCHRKLTDSPSSYKSMHVVRCCQYALCSADGFNRSEQKKIVERVWSVGFPRSCIMPGMPLAIGEVYMLYT